MRVWVDQVLEEVGGDVCTSKGRFFSTLVFCGIQRGAWSSLGEEVPCDGWKDWILALHGIYLRVHGIIYSQIDPPNLRLDDFTRA